MTTASDLLGSRDNPALRVRLLPVVPEQVPVRPIGHKAPLLPGWVAAITLPWGIYLRYHVLEGDPDRISRLIIHELVHMRQWKTLGTVRFLTRYLADYLGGRLRRLGHREAYLRIRLEDEAYLEAGRY